MADSETNNMNMILADRIIDNNLHKNTKQKYSNKIKHFSEWFQKNHMELCISLDNNELDLVAIATTPGGYQAMKEFYAYISKKRNKDGSEKYPVEHQSFEHVSGYKSAIKNYFKSKRVQFSKESEMLQSEFFGGYKRLIAEEKQNGLRKIREGKVPLTFPVYRYIAQLALQYDRDFNCAVFAHTFLLLCWNLIARCVSVASLMYNHISWKEDAMVIVFPTSNADKEGKNCSPKHVFANPLHPEICPILSFGVYLFTSGVRRNGANPTVFENNVNNTEDRFSGWLRTICSVRQNLDMQKELGVDVLEVGTHSFRKGVAEFLSGMVGGASPISIYLRAGWSLGPVQSRYILEAQGGDQLCGRAASGLNITNNEFSSLPPHFDTRNGSILTVNEWDNILPGYSTFYPALFRPVISFLLASVVHHRNWLITTLPQSHPLFNTRLWTSGIINRLVPWVLTGSGRNSTSLLTATGIPPHILLANEIAKVDEKLESVKATLIARLETLPEQLKAVMLENFQINGVLPITHSQVVSMISNLENTILNAMQQQNQVLIQQQQQSSAQSNDNNNTHDGFRMWSWKGRFHPVPQDFKFPSDNMSNIWNLWWDGKPNERIAPYRKLMPYDIDNKNMSNRFIKARRVMEFIISHSGKTSLDIASSSSAEKIRYLQDAYLHIFDEWYGDQSEALLDRRTVSSMSYISFYELIKGSGKRIRYGAARGNIQHDTSSENGVE